MAMTSAPAAHGAGMWPTCHDHDSPCAAGAPPSRRMAAGTRSRGSRFRRRAALPRKVTRTDSIGGTISTPVIQSPGECAQIRVHARFSRADGRSGARAGWAAEGASSGGGARRSVGVATQHHARRSATGSRRLGGGGLDAVVDRRDSLLSGAGGVMCGDAGASAINRGGGRRRDAAAGRPALRCGRRKRRPRSGARRGESEEAWEGVKRTLAARSDARADGAAGEHAWPAVIRQDGHFPPGRAVDRGSATERVRLISRSAARHRTPRTNKLATPQPAVPCRPQR
jgi:hypothetical protein